MSKTELLILVLWLYVVGTSVFLWVALKKIEEIEKAKNVICNAILAQNKSIIAVQKAIQDLLSQEVILEKQYEAIDDSYGIITHSYDQMTEAFHMIADQHKELLKAWEKIENRYSDTYEILNGLRKSWDETRDQIETALQPWLIDSDDIYSYEKQMKNPSLDGFGNISIVNTEATNESGA